MKRLICLVGLVAAVSSNATETKLTGPFGKRLDLMIRNHVAETDAKMLSDVFRDWKLGDREYWWHTEFWGKYMHSAVPFWKYAGDEKIKRHVDESVANIMSIQEPCGYIGNYGDKNRYGRGWDVWGTKYTLMGLLHYYDGFRGTPRGEAALAAAKRLCDYLIGELGPNGRRGRPLHRSGSYGGMPSGSVLEPVMWLYRRTGESRYLDFASYVVDELCTPKDGPQLVKMADVPVADRKLEEIGPWHKSGNKWYESHQLTKAYEMMSCYQGLIEYYEVTGKREYLEAAIKTADSIVATEINLAGGSAAGEYWFHGADQQYRHISWQQETCVITTWMRLCEKLLTVSGDPKWADQLELTFYNAYLGSMSREADRFAAYTPLMGCRCDGHHHCKMHTDCCNANGPRGYLTVLNTILRADEKSVAVNFYLSGHAHATLPSGKTVEFQTYTNYPRDEKVELWYQTPESRAFTLKLRIPEFSSKTKVLLNGKALDVPVVSGTYCDITREWSNSDHIEIVFDLPVVMHRLHDYVAFTRGPICLARDTRFNDGALDDEIQADKITEADLAAFRVVRPATTDMYMAVAAALPSGSHTENPDFGKHPSVIHFTDYASAGNTWQPNDRYRVWLPELIPGRGH